jgi:DNA-binding CsgD family transcriptional regulator
VIAAADDAAIIRQALAMLSPAERAALVMWEMEGRSTSEIASELGIKESAVRHTVSRARASLRRVLSELVIDEERGLTALDMLSTSYKKASEIAQKSSKVALSLLLVVTAFLGFNSLTGNEGNVQVSDLAISTPSTVQEEVVTPTAPVAVEQAQKISKPSGISLQEYNDQMDISIAQLESVAVMAQTMAMLQAAEEEGSN